MLLDSGFIDTRILYWKKNLNRKKEYDAQNKRIIKKNIGTRKTINLKINKFQIVWNVSPNWSPIHSDRNNHIVLLFEAFGGRLLLMAKKKKIKKNF